MLRRHILKMVAFLVLLVFVDWALYAMLCAGFSRTEVGETGGMVNKVRQVKADVVILGSSRAWRHYDSSILKNALDKSVYNAGCDGQEMPYIHGVADLLLRDYAPDLLIINIDPPTIVASDSGLDRVTQLAPFIGESEAIREMIYRRGIYEPLKYLSRSFRYNSKLLQIFKNYGRKDDLEAGFNPADKTMDLDMVAKLPVGAADDPLVGDAYLVTLLRKTLRSASTAGTRVVLVSSPRWRDDHEDDPSWGALYAFIAQCAQEEGAGYVAITQGNTPRFHNPSLFADRGHLNRNGARIFSEMLSQWLVNHGYAARNGTVQLLSEFPG